jgi:hypothetical protein
MVKPAQQLKEAYGDLNSFATGVVDTMPVGLLPGSFAGKPGVPTLFLKKRARLSMDNVALVSSFKDDANQEEADEIGKRVFDTLINTALRDVDVIEIRAFELPPAHQTQRSDANVVPSAKIIERAARQGFDGPVKAAITPVIDNVLAQWALKDYLPWVEASVRETRYKRAPVIGMVAVVGPTRLAEEFGINHQEFRDGGVITHSSQNVSWQQVSQGHQLGMLRNDPTFQAHTNK